ncbi:MAG: hypothetical protein ACJ74Z_07205 [Bryobacteraceae bacterium]
MSDLNKRHRTTGSRAHGSTGPKTPEGKAKASQNSTTHGCCSKQPIIKGENEEEFNELLEDWMDDYRRPERAHAGAAGGGSAMGSEAEYESL